VTEARPSSAAAPPDAKGALLVDSAAGLCGDILGELALSQKAQDLHRSPLAALVRLLVDTITSLEFVDTPIGAEMAV
jgi:hypothetical protein